MRRLSQVVKAAWILVRGNESSLYPLTPLQDFVSMSELLREVEPILLPWKGGLIAALPAERISDFLVYPLPAKAVRILTEVLSRSAEPMIAIRLPDGTSQQIRSSGTRVVLFAGPTTLACLYDLISCHNNTTIRARRARG